MGLAFVAVFLYAGSMSTSQIVTAQQQMWYGVLLLMTLPAWSFHRLIPRSDQFFYPVLLAVLLAGAYLLMHHTAFGRQNAAIGENPTAARQSGIDINRTRVLAYLVEAVLIGVAAFFAMCRTRTVATLAGSAGADGGDLR